MKEYKCKKCGYIYNEKRQEEKWQNLNDYWTCPLCETSKSNFEEMAGESEELLKETLAIIIKAKGKEKTEKKQIENECILHKTK